MAILFYGLPAIAAWAELFTRITAENGSFQYDIKKDWLHGWYTEPGQSQRFKVTFKQGERNSASPVLVATLRTTTTEHYAGAAAVVLQIDARHENNGGTAAYKVALASAASKQPFTPPILEERDWFHGFAMKIDPKYYKVGSEEVIFEQFHQGAPFHPPIALLIVGSQGVARRGWKGGGSDGHFALRLIDDDHGPLNSLPGKPQYYDLGPVTTGRWMEWVIQVRPAPVAPDGRIKVYRDGKSILDLSGIKVGFNPSNPQYGTQRPTPFFDGEEVMLYRLNGDNFQRIFFDEIRFADRLEDVRITRPDGTNATR